MVKGGQRPILRGVSIASILSAFCAFGQKGASIAQDVSALARLVTLSYLELLQL